MAMLLVLFFDVGSSYHCESEFIMRWIVHPIIGNVSWDQTVVRQVSFTQLMCCCNSNPAHSERNCRFRHASITSAHLDRLGLTRRDRDLHLHHNWTICMRVCVKPMRLSQSPYHRLRCGCVFTSSDSQNSRCLNEQTGREKLKRISWKLQKYQELNTDFFKNVILSAQY